MASQSVPLCIFNFTQLYLLDLRKEDPLSWMCVPITGVTPGRRYGHSMAYHKISEGHNRANLIVFGGNDGYVI